uniref:Probable GPI-anchored adhesin-like protein PGA55-like n=1 Tax=Saccoglossus kowalevskii TaxID=10224 RepID=A0ABM0MHK7_SACKO|nr:PREDICTED: probable GPI-anchored adhesin-like protein PGA55-like [Saccoglossus kowalevskii]
MRYIVIVLLVTSTLSETRSLEKARCEPNRCDKDHEYCCDENKCCPKKKTETTTAVTQTGDPENKQSLSNDPKVCPLLETSLISSVSSAILTAAVIGGVLYARKHMKRESDEIIGNENNCLLEAVEQSWEIQSNYFSKNGDKQLASTAIDKSYEVIHSRSDMQNAQVNLSSDSVPHISSENDPLVTGTSNRLRYSKGSTVTIDTTKDRSGENSIHNKITKTPQEVSTHGSDSTRKVLISSISNIHRNNEKKRNDFQEIISEINISSGECDSHAHTLGNITNCGQHGTTSLKSMNSNNYSDNLLGTENREDNTQRVREAHKEKSYIIETLDMKGDGNKTIHSTCMEKTINTESIDSTDVDIMSTQQLERSDPGARKESTNEAKSTEIGVNLWRCEQSDSWSGGDKDHDLQIHEKQSNYSVTGHVKHPTASSSSSTGDNDDESILGAVATTQIHSGRSNRSHESKQNIDEGESTLLSSSNMAEQFGYSTIVVTKNRRKRRNRKLKLNEIFQR